MSYLVPGAMPNTSIQTKVFSFFQSITDTNTGFLQQSGEVMNDNGNIEVYFPIPYAVGSIPAFNIFPTVGGLTNACILNSIDNDSCSITVADTSANLYSWISSGYVGDAVSVSNRIIYQPNIPTRTFNYGQYFLAYEVTIPINYRWTLPLTFTCDLNITSANPSGGGIPGETFIALEVAFNRRGYGVSTHFFLGNYDTVQTYNVVATGTDRYSIVSYPDVIQVWLQVNRFGWVVEAGITNAVFNFPVLE